MLRAAEDPYSSPPRCAMQGGEHQAEAFVSATEGVAVPGKESRARTFHYEEEKRRVREGARSYTLQNALTSGARLGNISAKALGRLPEMRETRVM